MGSPGGGGKSGGSSSVKSKSNKRAGTKYKTDTSAAPF